VEGEAEFYRNRYIQRSSRRPQRGPASLSGSDRTHLPPLSPDALSPNDAADAHDPGTLNAFQAPPPGVGDRLFACCDLDMKGVGGPDFETKRLLTLAIPTTINAVADPFFRIILVAMISHFIDTNSMIAYVLVVLFLRVTTVELSIAIIDAESTMLQDALSLGNDPGHVIAGHRVQLAVFMQLLLTVPVLVAWVFGIDNVVLWLTPETPEVAELARQYTQVIVIDFALQAIAKAFMLVFHLTGHGRFEINVDLCSTALTIIVVAATVGVVAEPTLVLIGWIQVCIGIFKLLAKIYYVVIRGWLKPYRPGLFGGFSLLDKGAVLTFLSLVFPLLMGSLVELREWEILLLFVRHLGGAEVATWALMGLIWEVFEGSNEGLSDSGAVRVSYYLAEGMPELAMMLTSKTIFLAMVQSLTLTAIFLMAGPNISVALTNDATMQHLFNDLVGMTGLANISMSFTQIYWGLLSAQGRFSIASCCMLLCRWVLTMPIAAACIYGPSYDARSAAGAVAVGYGTAAIGLSIFVYRTDWHQAVLDAQEEVTPMEEGVDLDESDDEEESEDDSSTGFG
jgi:Na+-driven multidrug efflux pump